MLFNIDKKVDARCPKCLIKKPLEKLDIDLFCDECIKSLKKERLRESLNTFANRLYHYGHGEL